MGRIILLPDELANKIAAGEVVERPASVVKELIENSLDAGASSIEIEVAGGGRKLIRVADNGDGMQPDEVELSFKRHATSKLASEGDLVSIRTLGFRGEALPSIASVAKVRLETAPRGSNLAVAVRLEGGAVKEVREAASYGTSVEVRDLFYNTPARAKFLKRTSTELIHIIDAVTRLALSHPEVGFKVKVDGQETMQMPRASGERERIGQLYGVEFLEGLLEVEAGAGGMSMRAFVSRPGNLRRTRANQMVFLNGRPVKEQSISHAIYNAYDAPAERFPMYFVFLHLDAATVDFNVHPAKKEVRLADKEAVHRFIRRAVREKLFEGAALGMPASAAPEGAAVPLQVPRDWHYPTGAAARHGQAYRVSEDVPLSYRAETQFVYLGDSFVAYANAGGGITLMDHHAAHERVMYERILKGMDMQGRRLLFPRQVKLSSKEHMAIVNNKDMLFEMGFDVDDFGSDTVVVRALPAETEEADLRGVICDAAEAMLDGDRPGRPLREAVAARVACHSSVRGSVVLSAEALTALINDLEKTNRPGECPHGRPTRISYTLEDLKKLFKRK